jgi:hypothetical protein
MKQYSFYNVDLLIDGLQVTGFPDGQDLIVAQRNSAQHAQIIDARGEQAVVTSADMSGTISFSLLQTSDDHLWLSGIATAYQQLGTSGDNATFVPLQVLLNDKMGTTLVTGINATIIMQPAVSRGTGLATATYVLQCGKLTFVRGQYVNTGI